MLKDAPNVVVIYDFIEHELERLFGNFPPDVREQFRECASRFFRGELAFDDAQQVFFGNCAGDSLLRKIQQLTEITHVPIPPPADAGPFMPAGARRKSFPWTEAEDMRLLVAVSRWGARDWRSIAEFVGSGRSSSQCNQRWCRALDPAILHKPWSDADDQKLLRAVEVLGKASWCQIAKIMSGRTDLQCRYRYLQLAKVTEVAGKAEEPAEPPPPPVIPNVDQIAKKRRNSISIASFTGDIELDRIGEHQPASFRLPYYLESSLRPRNDPNQDYLHRVPPLLFSRSPRNPEKK
jgi:hypothetical protein